MNTTRILLPKLQGSTQKHIVLVELNQGEEYKADSSLGVTFGHTYFLENGTRIGDKFSCCLATKEMEQQFKVSFVYKNTNEIEVVNLDEGTIPAWTEFGSVPKSRFDSYGPDFFNNIEFRRVFSRNISKENNNTYISVTTDPEDISQNIPLLKKHYSLSENDTLTVKQGCIALLQHSNNILVDNINHKSIYYIIAKTQDVILKAIKDTKIIVIRYDDSIQEI